MTDTLVCVCASNELIHMNILCLRSSLRLESSPYVVDSAAKSVTSAHTSVEPKTQLVGQTAVSAAATAAVGPYDKQQHIL